MANKYSSCMNLDKLVSLFDRSVYQSGSTDEERRTSQTGRSHTQCLREARSYVDRAVSRRRVSAQA